MERNIINIDEQKKIARCFIIGVNAIALKHQFNGKHELLENYVTRYIDYNVKGFDDTVSYEDEDGKHSYSLALGTTTEDGKTVDELARMNMAFGISAKTFRHITKKVNVNGKRVWAYTLAIDEMVANGELYDLNSYCPGGKQKSGLMNSQHLYSKKYIVNIDSPLYNEILCGKYKHISSPEYDCARPFLEKLNVDVYAFDPGRPEGYVPHTRIDDIKLEDVYDETID